MDICRVDKSAERTDEALSVPQTAKLSNEIDFFLNYE